MTYQVGLSTGASVLIALFLVIGTKDSIVPSEAMSRTIYPYTVSVWIVATAVWIISASTMRHISFFTRVLFSNYVFILLLSVLFSHEATYHLIFVFTAGLLIPGVNISIMKEADTDKVLHTVLLLLQLILTSGVGAAALFIVIPKEQIVNKEYKVGVMTGMYEWPFLILALVSIPWLIYVQEKKGLEILATQILIMNRHNEEETIQWDKHNEHPSDQCE